MPKKKKAKKTYRKSFIYNGQRYYAQRADSEAEAIANMIRLKEQVERNDVYRATGMTVREWADECVPIYKVKQSEVTRKVYVEKMDLFILRHIGDMRLKDVTPIKCQELLNRLSGKSKSSINQCHQQLRFLFGMAKVNRLILYDPTTDLIKPAGTYHPRRKLTTYEEEIFLKVLPLHHFGLYYGFMYYCGCRPSEAAEIRGRDIQNVDGEWYLHIRGTKTDTADRYVPIVPDLMKMIPESREPFALLCPNTRGEKMNKRNNLLAWKHLERLMNIAMGCKVYRNQLQPPFPLATDLSAYCLRHTFCTNLQKQGVDIRAAQYLMGHSDIQMTANIYTHSDFEIIGSVAKQMRGDVPLSVPPLQEAQ